MKAVLLMFDTLTRRHLAPYGGDAITPNFSRLAEAATQFDNFYAGSLPCMPARRDMHTGRYNFLHRSWGPLEPFDFSVYGELGRQGVHTHLVTDHKHYWRDGGATYHTRYSTFEFIRGQEGDHWIGQVEKPEIRYRGLEDAETIRRRSVRMAQDVINRAHMPRQEDHYTHRTITAGLDFIDRNKDADNWLLQIECFDPHEPFFVPEKYLAQYGLVGDDFDGWVPYYCATQSPEHGEKVRKFYQALTTMCDDYLGRVMDRLKATGLWDDTLFIVCTDHGFLLGEHDWWGKNIMPVYDEIAHTPFFIHYPGGAGAGERRQSLAQTIDIPATLLDHFGLEKPESMLGQSVRPIVTDDTPVRTCGLFGYFGGHINITDGRQVYMRSPRVGDKSDLFEYTLMPTRIDSPFAVKDLKAIEIHPGFSFTQGAQIMRIPATFGYLNAFRFGDKLFDLAEDPEQRAPLDAPDLALDMAAEMKALMQANDAPPELYRRFGLDPLDPTHEAAQQADRERYDALAGSGFGCAHRGVYEALLRVAAASETTPAALAETLGSPRTLVEPDIFTLIATRLPEARQAELVYQARLLLRVV